MLAASELIDVDGLLILPIDANGLAGLDCDHVPVSPPPGELAII